MTATSITATPKQKALPQTGTTIPDVLADATTSTRVALALSHLVAAAIVIPALASRLSD